MEFSLSFDVSIQLNFPVEQYSLNPVNLAVEVSTPLRAACPILREVHSYPVLNKLLVATHHLTSFFARLTPRPMPQ